MASLTDLGSHSFIYLNAHHSFGRLAHSVNTLLRDSQISRIHAVIEWEADGWKLVDLSRNGTWLNGERLNKDVYHPLQCGDKISLESSNSICYQVNDLAPPADILIAVEGNTHTEQDVISLESYNLLPDEHAPEYAFYVDASGLRWQAESMLDNTADIRSIEEFGLLSFAGKRWQLQLNHADAQTQAIDSHELALPNITCIFDLSSDEESTCLTLQAQQQTYDLEMRIHHYLTLNLARYKAADMQKGVNEADQGWIYAEQLAKDLGLNESHINIHIHRARKQFSDTFAGLLNASEFIQRRAGKVRTGISEFKIVKGQQVECEVRQGQVN